MSEPTTSLRDAIESALEEPEAAAPAAQATPEPAAPVESEPVAVESAEPAGEPAADLNALAEGGEADNEQVQQPERDEQGKFKKTDGVTPGPKAEPKQQAAKAPASWRPEVREHWNQLPDTVRGEIARRESEVARTLQETAEARKTAEAVMKTIAPYEAFIKAENSSPLQAIDNLMSTAARLRTGTAPELATLVAGIVQQFGVGRFGNGFIEALDSALAGQTPRLDPQQAAIDQVLNQRLAPIQSMFQQFQSAQQQQQQLVAQQAQSEVEQFLNQSEFGNDVREDMADLLEAAQRRGQSMTLKQAYDKACMLNDSVAKVMQQRRLSQGAQVQTQAAQRARSAAVSVSGSAPVGALQQPATDVRSAIEAAIQMSSR
jgi:hypothetical protein